MNCERLDRYNAPETQRMLDAIEAQDAELLLGQLALADSREARLRIVRGWLKARSRKGGAR